MNRGFGPFGSSLYTSPSGSVLANALKDGLNAGIFARGDELQGNTSVRLVRIFLSQSRRSCGSSSPGLRPCSHTPHPSGVAPPENSVTKSRADSALTQQVVGCIEAINS